MGPQRGGEHDEVLVPSMYLEETTAQRPEPILELSGDALTEGPSLQRRKISQSHVVGFDHGVRINDPVESADDEPGVTARLGIRTPPAEQLGPVEILRGPSACLLAGNAPHEEGGGPSLVANERS